MILAPAVVLVFAIGGTLFAALREGLLPSRYLLDGRVIQSLAQDPNAGGGGTSYRFTAGVYRALGLAEDAQLASVVSYLFVLLCYAIVVIRMRRAPIGFAAAALLVIGLGLSTVYLADYSKDAIALAVPTVVAAVAGRRSGLIVAVLAAVAYGVLVRQYWVPVAAGFFALSLLFRRLRPALSRWAIGAVVLTLGVSAAIFFGLQVDPDFYRLSSNVERLNSEDATTIIRPFLGGGGFIIGAANNLLTLGAFVVPLPLALLGGGYALLAVAILAIWVLFLTGLVRLGSAEDRGQGTLAAAAFVVAFVAVQACFEPDYGSYLRHLTVVLPLMCLVCWQTSSRDVSGTAAEVPARTGRLAEQPH